MRIVTLSLVAAAAAALAACGETQRRVSCDEMRKDAAVAAQSPGTDRKLLLAVTEELDGCQFLRGLHKEDLEPLMPAGFRFRDHPAQRWRVPIRGSFDQGEVLDIRFDDKGRVTRSSYKVIEIP